MRRRAKPAARPGSAALARADGQLTRAACPSKNFDYNQPLIRKGPTTRPLRNGQKKLVRSLRGFFRNKYYEYLVHVPVGGAAALSLEGVSQMVYILPERLLALVRPAF